MIKKTLLFILNCTIKILQILFFVFTKLIVMLHMIISKLIEKVAKMRNNSESYIVDEDGEFITVIKKRKKKKNKSAQESNQKEQIQTKMDIKEINQKLNSLNNFLEERRKLQSSDITYFEEDILEYMPAIRQIRKIEKVSTSEIVLTTEFFKTIHLNDPKKNSITQVVRYDLKNLNEKVINDITARSIEEDKTLLYRSYNYMSVIKALKGLIEFPYIDAVIDKTQKQLDERNINMDVSFVPRHIFEMIKHKQSWVQINNNVYCDNDIMKNAMISQIRKKFFVSPIIIIKSDDVIKINEQNQRNLVLEIRMINFALNRFTKKNLVGIMKYATIGLVSQTDDNTVACGTIAVDTQTGTIHVKAMDVENQYGKFEIFYTTQDWDGVITIDS